MFENQVLVRVDDREDYGEERFAALGHVEGEFFTLIYTPKRKQNPSHHGMDER